MNSSAQIVAGGGWVKRQVKIKPKTRFFTALALLWPLIALPTALILLGGLHAKFPGLTWLCLLLVLPEPAFVLFAVWFGIREQPRLITRREPNLGCDPRKLY